MKKNIFGRIRKKLLKVIIYQVIYKNHIYKPSGVYTSITDYVVADPTAQATSIDIYPKLISTLHISKKLYELCSEYVRPVFSVETDYKVAIIPNGRIHTDNESSVAIISPDNKLIGDVSFNYKSGKIVPPEQNTIFKQKFYVKPKKVQGTVFTLLTGGAGLNNYFHWMVDSLPRIHLLQKSGYFSQIDWFLVPSYQILYQKNTLNLLGITEDKIIAGDEYPHIKADTLVACTAPRGNSTIIPVWICDFLRNNFTKTQIKPSSVYRHIYISREDSAYRRIMNEEDITSLLKKYHFNKVVLNQLAFQEQVDLFASAEVIIAPHGAGLINLAFCKKDTIILEIFASGYVKPTYYDLSQKIGLKYYYLICPGKKAKTARQGMKLDIFVDIPELESLLNELLPASPDRQLIK